MFTLYAFTQQTVVIYTEMCNHVVYVPVHALGMQLMIIFIII